MLYNYIHLQCHALFVIVVDIVVTLYFAVSWHSVVLCLLVWVMPSNIWSFRLPIHLLTCQKNRYSAETFTQPKITDWGTMSNISHCTQQPAVNLLCISFRWWCNCELSPCKQRLLKSNVCSIVLWFHVYIYHLILRIWERWLFYNNYFQAKGNLIKSIDKFIQERIILAGVAISETYARTKINDGDVILTYAWWV